MSIPFSCSATAYLGSLRFIGVEDAMNNFGRLMEKIGG